MRTMQGGIQCDWHCHTPRTAKDSVFHHFGPYFAAAARSLGGFKVSFLIKIIARKNKKTLAFQTVFRFPKKWAENRVKNRKVQVRHLGIGK